MSSTELRELVPRLLPIAAHSGQLDLVKQCVTAGLPIDFTNGRDNTALHMAVSQKREGIAKYLIENGANINAANLRGRTPLMLAVIARCKTDFLEYMLEHGADVWKRCRQRFTAEEYARSHKFKKAEAVLSAFAANIEDPREARKLDGISNVCPICGDELRKKSKLQYLVEHLESNPDHDNMYLHEFMQSDCFIPQLKSDPRFHRITEQNRMKKEVTESLAIITKLGHVRTKLGFGSPVTFIDLCSGKSLTSTLFTLSNPNDRVIAVDKLSLHLAPHFNGNSEYIQADIMTSKFQEEFKTVLSSGQHDNCVLGAMHLCGMLSMKAVELFQANDKIKSIILSPCCLPGNNTSIPIAAESGTKDQVGQYMYWCEYLKNHLEQLGNDTQLHVDPYILSQRNVVIVASKPMEVQNECTEASIDD